VGLPMRFNSSFLVARFFAPVFPTPPPAKAPPLKKTKMDHYVNRPNKVVDAQRLFQVRLCSFCKKAVVYSVFGGCAERVEGAARSGARYHKAERQWERRKETPRGRNSTDTHASHTAEVACSVV